MEPRTEPGVTQPGYRKGRRPPNFGRTFPPEVLTGDEVLALIAACRRRDDPVGPRNQALVIAMWRGGLRVSEALALRPSDVDPRGALTVVCGKGGRRRVVGVDAETLAALERWSEVRADLGVNGTAPLFCAVTQARRGGPIRAAYVRDFLKRAAERAGIDKRVHPHGLRHTHATELAYEDVPLPVIQAQLGHSSLVTTERYIRELAPAALVRAMQARSWPGENGH